MLHMNDQSWNNPREIAAQFCLAQSKHESWGIALYDRELWIKQHKTKNKHKKTHETNYMYCSQVWAWPHIHIQANVNIVSHNSIDKFVLLRYEGQPKSYTRSASTVIWLSKEIMKTPHASPGNLTMKITERLPALYGLLTLHHKARWLFNQG